MSLVADEPVAECACCHRHLPAEELLLCEDFTFVCEPCFADGAGEVSE